MTPPLGLTPGDVALAPPTPAWRRAFESERARIAALLGDLAVAIEHVGSTAVADLCAKPIIDIAIAIGDGAVVDGVSELLEAGGYRFAVDAGTNGGRIFFKESPDGARTHHLHVIAASDRQWANYLLFRDKLQSEPALREDYARLKQRLAREFAHDRDAYTAAKADFIERALRPT